MLENKTVSRINGLDTLRTLAILLVLMSHYGVVVSNKSTFGVLTDVGWMGVDLFFVLSGYLIGNQIMSTIARGEEFSLKIFFARRLLRTLPNYYVVLAAYLLFPSVLSGSSTAAIWRYFTFTQNIGLHYGETFSHSWSLCIEEQFYIILPIATILIAGLGNSLRWAWIAIIGGVIAGMVARGMAWMDHGYNLISSFDYSAHIYYSSFARFDELLPGVAIAMLKNFHGPIYEKIVCKGNALLIGGTSTVVVIAYLFQNFLKIDGYGYSFILITFGYPLLAAGFALLTMSTLGRTALLARIRVPGAQKFALWSYAVYLAHKPIFKVAVLWLRYWDIDADAPYMVFIVMAAGIAGGWLLYRMVESPFMALRDRLFPSTRMQVRVSSQAPGELTSQV